MPIFKSGYGSKTTPVDNDTVLIADSEASDAIKGTKISAIIAKAVAAVQALTNWITTAMLQNSAVTSEKIDFSSFIKQFADSNGQITYGNAAGIGSYTDITDATYTFTPDRDYTYIAVFQCRFGNGGTQNRRLRILQNGVDQTPEISAAMVAGLGMTMTAIAMSNISEGVETTIKAQFSSSSANEIIYSSKFTILAIPM